MSHETRIMQANLLRFSEPQVLLPKILPLSVIRPENEIREAKLGTDIRSKESPSPEDELGEAKLGTNPRSKA